MISIWTQFSGRFGFPNQNLPGAATIRVCRQAEFLRHAEALERWAEARDCAVAALERAAGHLDRDGLVDQALHLRQAACEEHRRAARLRAALAVHSCTA
jgi:hypothetical protein